MEVRTMATIRQTIQTGKKEPMISTDGARPQPAHSRQISGAGIKVLRVIVVDYPRVAGLCFLLRALETAQDCRCGTRDRLLRKRVGNEPRRSNNEPAPTAFRLL